MVWLRPPWWTRGDARIRGVGACDVALGSAEQKELKSPRYLHRGLSPRLIVWTQPVRVTNCTNLEKYRS